MANLIRGTKGADNIDGTGGADEILGHGGDDTIEGHGGGDRINGGGGNDSIRVADDDTIYGGAGDDTIIAYRVWGDFKIYGGSGDDTVTLTESSPYFYDTVIDGGKGFDTIVFGGQNLIYLMDIVSVERFVFDRSGYEIRASEDQIFDASGNMKVEVVGATDETGLQALSILSSDGLLDASKLEIANWDENDQVQLWGSLGDDRVIGSDYADALIGFGGNDTLDGGAGADWLRGGAGEDVFVIDAACGPDAIDTIEDFTVGDDRILIEAHGLRADKIRAGNVHVGTEAADKSDRLIYDRDTGALYFDRDGSRSGFDPVKIAQLDAGLDLDHKDFILG